MASAAPTKTLRVAVIIFVIAVILIVFIYFVGRSSGKNKAEKDKAQKEKLPNNGKGIPDGWSPDSLVSELHDAMDGIFAWSGTREAAYSKLLGLTKDQLVAVYNRFNSLHGSKGNTLYNWIKDEFHSGPQQAKALAALEMNNLP